MKRSMRTRTVAASLVVGLMLGLLGGRLLAPPSAAAQGNCTPDQRVPQTVLQQLAAMNQELNSLQTRLLTGRISVAKTRERIRELIRAKHAMLGSFPDVFGLSFEPTYSSLESMDFFLDAARDATIGENDGWRESAAKWAGEAQKNKEILEGNVQSSPCGTR